MGMRGCVWTLRGIRFGGTWTLGIKCGARFGWLLEEFHIFSTSTWARILAFFLLQMEKYAQSMLRFETMDALFAQPTFRFKVEEFVRSHLGIWAHAHNVVPLLLGCLFSTTWLRRLQNVSVVQTIDAGSLWTCTGRTTSSPCWFVMAEEVNDVGFVVRYVLVESVSQWIYLNIASL